MGVYSTHSEARVMTPLAALAFPVPKTARCHLLVIGAYAEPDRYPYVSAAEGEG